MAQRYESQNLWQAHCLCWIDINLGSPHLIVHDAEKNFMNNFFQANTDMLHVCTKSVPVESANSMTVVAGCHSPIRRAYNIV